MIRTVVCPKCGSYQNTIAEAVLKCYRCGKSTPFIKHGVPAIRVIKTFDSAEEGKASEYIRRLKQANSK